MGLSTFTLRAATTADLPVIRDIAKKAWAVTFRDILTPEFLAHELKREYSDEAISRQMAQGHCYLIIETANGPAGYAAYQHLSGTLTKLHKLYLYPQLKGQGLGFALISAVEAAAHKAGKTDIELLVNRDNPSILFYERQGYVLMGSLDTQVGPDFWRHDYVMRKNLSLNIS